MNRNILVPLGRKDQVEGLIPYFEKLANPGMRVVFLVRYPVDTFRWQSVAMEAACADGFHWQKEGLGMRSARDAVRLRERLRAEHLRKAEERVSCAFQLLQRQGAEVTVDVYTGSLRKAVRSYTRSNHIHLVMRPAGIGWWMAKLLNSANPVFKYVKQPGFSSVLLIHPRAVV